MLVVPLFIYFVSRGHPPPPVLPNCQSAKWRSSGIVGKRVLYRGFVARGRKRREESWIRKTESKKKESKKNRGRRRRERGKRKEEKGGVKREVRCPNWGGGGEVRRPGGGGGG